jgi:hypothetical protein
MRIFRALLVGASLLAAVPAVALAGGGGGSPCAGFAAGGTVIMRDSCFEGVAHFVRPDSTLVVYNEGSAQHSLTAVDGSFDTGLLEPGASAEIEVGPEGIVQLYCTLHGTAQGQGMAGVLIVGEPDPSLVRVTGPASSLSADLPRRDEGLVSAMEAQSQALADLRSALDAQSQALEELKGESTALRQAMEAERPAPQPIEASVLGTLGVLAGGGALAVALRRGRKG